MSAERANAYLTIPRVYGVSLGNARWSPTADVIQRWNGTTLTFADELRAVLEGVFTRRPVPPFAFVLNLLHLMRDGPETASAEFDRLWTAFTAARGGAARARNAGLLIAELCSALPTAAAAPEWGDVEAVITNRGTYRRDPGTRPEEPPLDRPEFERRVADRLRHFDDAALLHWFAHGCAPAASGRRLARPVESLPARVARLVALARRRPRLVGAAALAPALDAALTLPPRRRTPDAVPQGGYCDVTTRGDPDRLLPSQFALDPDEFVRRFAGRELLYFKREEPHAAEKPERVIVLDQGVRTWGGVRLALAAAALTLLKADAKRVGRVRLAVTSSPDVFDVRAADLAAVADVLEASDLSPHPAGRLHAVLADPAADGLRDVILLTHPRNLREPAVTAAARAGRPADRLFTLAVDDRGRAELGEWTAGGPVPVRAFRVDLATAEAATVPGEPAPARTPGPTAGVWTGDVEPVGFPFRPGLVAEPVRFGFDAAGEWLVAAAADGTLHGLALDGSPPEVLPRPYRGGAVLKHVDALLGVAGGVVVCGRMPRPTKPGPDSTTIVMPGAPALVASASETPASPEVFVAAYYDRAARRVTVHPFELAGIGASWFAYPELNCVVVRAAAPPAHGCALDLTTLARFPCAPELPIGGRVAEAWSRSETFGTPPHTLPVFTRRSPDGLPGDDPYLFVSDNTLHVRTYPEWRPFEPQRDGKPLLAGAVIHHAQLAGDVLAVTLSRSGERRLVVFRGPDGAVVGEVAHYPPHAPFALSPDGRRLARRRPREVVVADTATPATARVVAGIAGLHNNLVVRLDTGRFGVYVQVGGHAHLFNVPHDELIHTATGVGASVPPKPKGAVYHPPTEYDTGRFPARDVAHAHGWRAVTDRLGAVHLFAADGRLVASFLVRRERAAAWIPGGTVWGDPALIGGPPTPDAARRIGRHLREAGA